MLELGGPLPLSSSSSSTPSSSSSPPPPAPPSTPPKKSNSTVRTYNITSPEELELRKKKIKESRDSLRKERHQNISDKRSTNNSPEKVPVQIFESPKYYEPSHQTRKQLDEEMQTYIKIFCEVDNREILVPQVIAFSSGLIRKMFDANSSYREKEQKVVHLDFSSEIIEVIISYCFEDHLINGKRFKSKRALFFDEEGVSEFTPTSNPLPLLSPLHSSSKPLTASPTPSPQKTPSKKRQHSTSTPSSYRAGICLPMSLSSILSVAMAAHYLDIPVLLDTVTSTIAENIDQVESLHLIPDDVIQQIYSHLTPEKLLEVENSDLHKQHHQNLDTSDLWYHALEKREWNNDDTLGSPYYCWDLEVKQIMKYMCEPNDTQMTSEGASAGGGEPRLSMKALYAQKAFQYELTTFALSSSPAKNGKKSTTRRPLSSNLTRLTRFHNLCSNWITSLFIPHDFSKVSEGLSLFYLIDNSPHLQHLNLSKTPMHQHSLDQLIKSLSKSSTLQNLNLSACRITDLAITTFLNYLCTNPEKIKQLDLSENLLTETVLCRFGDILEKADCALENLSLRQNELKSNHSFEPDENNNSNNSNCPSKDFILSSFFRVVGKNTSLRLLDLSTNYLNFSNLQISDLEVFSNNNSLLDLLLGNNPLIYNEQASWNVLQFFKYLPKSITHLDIYHTNVESIHLRELHNATLNSLRHLNLANNRLGDECCHILGEMLQSNYLLTLNISDNFLHDSGARILSQYIVHNTSLRCLKATQNKIRNGSLDIVNAFINAEKFIQLKLLDISNNEISLTVLHKISELLTNHQNILFRVIT